MTKLFQSTKQIKTGIELPAEDVGLVELQTALELDPESLAAITFMGLYWQRQGRYDLALDMFTAAAEVDPHNPAILADLGNTLAALGDLSTAQEHYHTAIELTPRDPTYLRAYAEFCMLHNIDLRNIALPTAREAVALAPDDPASLDVMGQVLFRLEDLLNAERFWQRALQKDPDYAPTYLHLGLLYIFQDQRDNARLYLEIARAMGQNSAIAEQAQQMLNDYIYP
jgi:tetratricopeptide (TPR) repeat protein